MCGRFVSSSTPERIAERFGAVVNTPALPVNFNVAPTSDVYAIVAAVDRTPTLRAYHWGLVPS